MSTVEEKRAAYVEEKLKEDGYRDLKTARKRWIFGLFGVHKFYLNHMGSGLAILLRGHDVYRWKNCITVIKKRL